ncbi:hypothetical protein ACVV2G_08815 [Streptomyces ziwulingensis]
MISYLTPLAAAFLIIASSMVILTRRDRRRMDDGGPDTMRIEESATRGLRDTRRRAHVYRDRFWREHE